VIAAAALAPSLLSSRVIRRICAPRGRGVLCLGSTPLACNHRPASAPLYRLHTAAPGIFYLHCVSAAISALYEYLHACCCRTRNICLIASAQKTLILKRGGTLLPLHNYSWPALHRMATRKAHVRAAHTASRERLSSSRLPRSAAVTLGFSRQSITPRYGVHHSSSGISTRCARCAALRKISRLAFQPCRCGSLIVNITAPARQRLPRVAAFAGF